MAVPAKVFYVYSFTLRKFSKLKVQIYDFRPFVLITAKKGIKFKSLFSIRLFESAYKLVKMGRKVSNIGVCTGVQRHPKFYVSSNGDPYVMLVCIFATDLAQLGSIGYPTTTTHIYFAT